MMKRILGDGEGEMRLVISECEEEWSRVGRVGREREWVMGD